jgi:hypothetical protein
VLLLEDDPATSTAHADCFDTYEQATTDYTRASNIWKAEKQRDDGVGDGGAARRVTARSVDSLKPDTLSKSMKPTEFRHWRQRFEDWHTASSFGATDMKSQIAFLRSVLELEISEKVDFTGAANIKTALDTMEQQFMKLYPLINRRVEFLTMNQKEGQAMSEHIISLTKAGQEADVDSMTPEDLKATSIISSSQSSAAPQAGRCVCLAVRHTHRSAKNSDSTARKSVLPWLPTLISLDLSSTGGILMEA